MANNYVESSAPITNSWNFIINANFIAGIQRVINFWHWTKKSPCISYVPNYFIILTYYRYARYLKKLDASTLVSKETILMGKIISVQNSIGIDVNFKIFGVILDVCDKLYILCVMYWPRIVVSIYDRRSRRAVATIVRRWV